MLLANGVALQVHLAAAMSTGSGNRTVGGEFRLLWRFPEEVTPEDVARCVASGGPVCGDVCPVADGALASFARTLAVRAAPPPRPAAASTSHWHDKSSLRVTLAFSWSGCRRTSRRVRASGSSGKTQLWPPCAPGGSSWCGEGSAAGARPGCRVTRCNLASSTPASRAPCAGPPARRLSASTRAGRSRASRAPCSRPTRRFSAPPRSCP